MAQNGRILLADDEQTFCYSTGELLRKEGYQCDCVLDAHEAIQKLKKNHYDLLIADIKMPGNPELELIKELTQSGKEIQIIIVTAYPSVKSAIEAIHLPVTAYMVKPFSFEDLKKNVSQSVRQSNFYQAILQTKNRIRESNKQFKSLEEILRKRSTQTFTSSIKSFLDFTLANISASFMDLNNITSILTNEKNESAVCNLVNCPKLEKLNEGLSDTIKTLELTKSSFKSKELGHLRIKLEQLLKSTKNI